MMRVTTTLDVTVDAFKKGIRLRSLLGKSLVEKIENYIEETKDYRKETDCLFITKQGKPVTRARLNQVFAKASNKAGINKISPERLR